MNLFAKQRKQDSNHQKYCEKKTVFFLGQLHSKKVNILVQSWAPFFPLLHLYILLREVFLFANRESVFTAAQMRQQTLYLCHLMI